MTFTPSGTATAVGSMPHEDADRAVDFVIRSFPDLPAWPQLPNRSFLENMYVQYSEGLPCLVVDTEREKIYFDTERDVLAEMEAFYTRLIEVDEESFAISNDYAAGLFRFIDRLSSDGEARSRLAAVKGQVVGPISFALTVTDQNKRAILYHEELMDAVVKTIAMRAAWMARALGRLHPQVMIWLDEPYLASFGSAYVSLSEEQVISFIGEAVEAIHGAGALAGIHCCGNTDWSLLMKTDLDIINFDAYDYFTGMTLYPRELRQFFERGKFLAVGLVPTSDRILEEDVESLAGMLRERIGTLAEKVGMTAGEVWERSLLTPSCGTGTLRKDLAERVLDFTSRLTEAM